MTEKTVKKFNVNFIIKIFAVLLLFTGIILPLCKMFTSLNTINIKEILISDKFLKATRNSILVSLTASLFSVILAFILAFILARSNIRFKGLIPVFLTVPMLIPSISHGMGLVILFGSNGIFTNMFGLSGNIYGFWGIVLGSIMYSFPVAFLMILDVFSYEDKSVYTAADILGISKFRQFINILLPYLKKSLISIFFSTFILIFTDYGVAMMIGGRYTVLPLYMYNEVIGQLRFGVGAVVSIVLLVPAISSLIFDVFNKDISNSNFINRQREIKKNKLFDIFGYIFCGLSIFLTLLPIIMFAFIGIIKKYPINITFSLDNLSTAFNMRAGRFLENSLLIALLVSIVGTICSYFIAYLTARLPSKFNNILHLMSISSLAIPGIVLGISYSILFKGSFLTGTLAILVLVNIVHFFSSPYLLCYNALNKVNKNYEIIIKTLKINKFRYIKDILLPETLDTVLEMFSYFFVNSMVTISAVSFLSNLKNMPLSLMINQFETQMLIECSAIVSVFILFINGIDKIIIYLIKRWRFINNAK